MQLSTAQFLNQLQQLNIPMIGMDASLVLCYRDEYKQVLGNERGDFEVILAHEWLIQEIQKNERVTSQKLKDYSSKENTKAFSTDDISEIFKEFIEVT